MFIKPQDFRKKVEEAASSAADNQIIHELSLLPNYLQSHPEALNEEIDSACFLGGQPLQ